MRVRFQADADLNHIIVMAIVRREPAVNFQPAVAARRALGGRCRAEGSEIQREARRVRVSAVGEAEGETRRT